MEQVLKAKSRSLKASPSIVFDDDSSGHGSDVTGKKRRRPVGETQRNPKSGPTRPNRSGSSDHDNKPLSGKVYFCKTCGREYPSFQALGGHQNGHKMEKTLEKLHMQMYGPYIDSIRTGYGPVHNNPPFALYGPFMERLYGVPQPLVAPRVPTHGPPGYIGEWPAPVWGDHVYGSYEGESSTGYDPNRDLATWTGSIRSEGGNDGAPRDDDDDNEDGVHQEVDLTLKI